MNVRIGSWIRIGLFAALPFATAGIAFGQSADPTPSGEVAPPSGATDNLPSANDTGNKAQQKANDTMDHNAPMNSDKTMDEKNMDSKGMDDTTKPDSDKTTETTTTHSKTHIHKKVTPHTNSTDTDLNK